MPHTIDDLLTCLPQDPERAATLWRASPELRAQAAREGVLAIVLHHLDPPRAQLELAAARVRSTWLRQHLAECLELLGAAGVATAPLKGPALEDRLYPAPGLRPSIDLDLLVRRSELDRAVEALDDAGWRLRRGPTERYQRQHHHHVHLERADAPLLELHQRAFTGFGVVLPSEPLLARARDGRLDPVDELLYLVLHVAGHHCERLLWLYDLKLLDPSPAEWDGAAQAATALGAGAAFAYVLTALRERLGVGAPPPEALGLPDTRGARHRLARWAGAAVNRLEHGRPAWTLAQLGFGALLCEPSTRAAPFLAHHLGRIARRRAEVALPNLAPKEWSA